MPSYRMIGNGIGCREQGVACLFDASSDLEALAVFRILKMEDLKGGNWENLRLEGLTTESGETIKNPRSIHLSRQEEIQISTHEMTCRALQIITKNSH